MKTNAIMNAEKNMMCCCCKTVCIDMVYFSYALCA